MYASQSDLNISSERLVELTENSSVIGVVDQTVIDRCHVRANALVDGALFGLYVTPVVSPPGILINVETAIWKYLLFTFREGMDAPKDVESDYAWAMKQLDAWRPGPSGRPLQMLNAPMVADFIAAMVV